MERWAAFAVAFFLACVICAIVVLVVLPSPIQPVSYKLPSPPALVDELAPNDRLTEAEHLFEGKIEGPESVVFDGGHIYTGTMDGKILDIYRGEARVLAQLGKEPCGRFEDEPTCGRPLGMRLDKDNYLIVADAYLGLFKVNVATGDVHTLYSSKEPIQGQVAKFLNDLDVASDGTIYLSDSSAKWGRRENRYCILEAENSGRYWLKGSKKGQLEIFMENLPGLPDNIRRNRRGTFWVGFATVRRAGKFSFLDFVSDKPWLKKLATKILSQEMIVKLVPKYGLVVEVSKEGKYVSSLHDPTGKVIPGTSEVEENDGVIYLGSYNLPFLSRLRLNKS